MSCFHISVVRPKVFKEVKSETHAIGHPLAITVVFSLRN